MKKAMEEQVGATEKADVFVIAQYGELQQFLERFEKTKINGKNENGSSLLHLAIAGRKFDVALYLINSGIDVNLTNKDNQSSLHLIAVNQNLDVASAILEKGGDVNIRDKYGNNAMWTAVFNCKGKNYDMVKLFAKYKPDICTINKAGKSPMDFALQVGNDTLVNLLREIK